MNKIINKFLLAADKFMPEIHKRQHKFTYSACGLFTKNKERIQKFKEKEIQDVFIKTSQAKRGFNMIWLMVISKIYLEEHLLRNKPFNVTKHPKYIG